MFARPSCVGTLAGALLALLAALAPASAQVEGREAESADASKAVQPILDQLQAGSAFRSVQVPMRDGVRLATDVFTPPGDGAWPAVLIRTPYGRRNVAGYAGRLGKGNYVFVTQDVRGDGDSEGRNTLDPRCSDNEIDDGYDCVEWIARQPWCNGRVGMIGGSGHGMAACMAYLSCAPHLVVVAPGNSAGNLYRYWVYENGVRRWLYAWLSNRNVRVTDWPRPTLAAYDEAKWQARVREAAHDNSTVFLNSDGWFNIFLDSAVDTFRDFGPTGRVFLSIGPGGHGASAGAPFPKRPLVQGLPPVPSFLEILDGKPVPERSRLEYYLMGDLEDPDAPGNVWKSTETWPIASEPRVLYLTVDGRLQTEKPSEPAAVRSYRYDPRDPAPTIGGAFSYGEEAPSGPLDQRPLRGRADVLRFETEPLAEPLAITGRVHADLQVSSDAPDTLFVVKVVDVYPSGAERMVRETAAMARYRDGLDHPAPMKKDKVYALSFDVATTAIVFNRGHRIAVLVASASTPAYEVHPNTYEPAASMADARVATSTIHVSTAHPSRVVLPVVAP